MVKSKYPKPRMPHVGHVHNIIYTRQRPARLKPATKDIAIGFGLLALTCAAIVGIIYYSI